MPHTKALIARLTTWDDYQRQPIYAHHDFLVQLGYDVPSGSELKQKVRDKIHRDKEPRPSVGGHHLDD